MPGPTTDLVNALARHTLEQASEAVIWIDQRGAILHANRAACTWYGYELKDFRHCTVFDINPAMDAGRWQDHWRTDRRQPSRMKAVHRKANGDSLPVEIQNRWVEVEGIYFSCSLIRRQGRQPAKLAKDLERNDLLSRFTVERTNDSVFWLDPEGAIEFANRAAAYRLGYAREALLSLSIFDINPQLTRAQLRDVWARLRNDKQITLESVHRTRDGQEIEVEINTNYLVFEGREFACSIARDISERKAQERALTTALEEISSLKEKLEAENAYMRKDLEEQAGPGEIITDSPKMRQVLRQMRRVAATESTVIILGESGTGKELVARALHRHSPRAEAPMIIVNCATLPENLIESELFGHHRGAFTGAERRKIGKFELADGGTLFLDEIGELPLTLQPKLLRALQEGEFEPLGGQGTRQADVRLLAATNRDLEKMVAEGTFREDLYFRLFVFPLPLPPLRERLEDLPRLVRHFCRKHARRTGTRIEQIDDDVLARLATYPFPGNVRELENIVERGIIMTDGHRLSAGAWLPKTPLTKVQDDLLPMAELQRRHIVRVLEHTGWKMSGRGSAAEILDMHPSTLASRMKKLAITRSNKASSA